MSHALEPELKTAEELTADMRDRAAMLVVKAQNRFIFLEHYMRCKSAPHAVVRAGWTEQVGIEATYIGRTFLSHPEVKDTLFASQSMSIMAPQEIMAELSNIARASLEDFLDISDAGEIQIDWRRAVALDRLGAVKKIKHTRYGVEIELHDRMAALKMLGVQQGMFARVVKQDSWRLAAIKDIRAGIVSFDDLVQAFKDEDLVRDLFREADVNPPEQRKNLLD